MYLSLRGVFVNYKLIHRPVSSVLVSAQKPEIVDEIWPEVQPVGRTARINCTVARLGDNTVSLSVMQFELL